ncbi:hypothetical protein Vadar_029154 [Vaccinium darrowii]|uniref:Uncharacterized protein n=1 Tax=Vaccinium darrowii TaxID=229202 RepID=A0ACB7XUR1_9ERIC|nr:hypothetical protein Vadar_029154 [Vaccinium darrowii]
MSGIFDLFLGKQNQALVTDEDDGGATTGSRGFSSEVKLLCSSVGWNVVMVAVGGGGSGGHRDEGLGSNMPLLVEVRLTLEHGCSVALILSKACCGVVSTLSAIEARYMHLNDDYNCLASQHLINVIPEYSQVCQKQPTDDSGCYSIHPLEALEHVKNHGVCYDIALPYEGKRTQGRPDNDTEMVYIVDYKTWRADQVVEVLNHHISVIGQLDIRSNEIFSIRDKRIYTEQNRGPKLGSHAIVICGHGRKDGIEYFNVLNSWGEFYGHQGFGRIARSLFYFFASPGVPYSSKPENRLFNRSMAIINAQTKGLQFQKDGTDYSPGKEETAEEGCSQSSHVLEVGELNLHKAEEYQECLGDSLFGVETNTGSLMHVGKFCLDWGKKGMESIQGDGLESALVLSVDATGMDFFLTLERVGSVTSTALSFKFILKSLSTSSKKPLQSRGGLASKPSEKRIQLLKFNLERCSVNFRGDVGFDNTMVGDPKRMNYGSQGRRFTVRVSCDSTPRCASIMSTSSDECNKLKYSVSLDIYLFSLCMNKEKQSTQMELERARYTYHYQEYVEDGMPGMKVAFFDLQNAKFVRTGGLKEIAICSLFSATDITARWETDEHIASFELVLQVKLLMHNQKLQDLNSNNVEGTSSVRGNDQEKDNSVESLQNENIKRKSLFATDIEMLSLFAAVGDGVDAMIHVQSIFLEDSSIRVLLEEVMLSFNEAGVSKSSQIQVSRIPNVSSGSSAGKLEGTATWDWVIQGLDVHICMPYRLQLHAIDDSIEDMLRSLKLVTSAKANLIFPTKREGVEPKKPSSTILGCVQFYVSKLTADTGEEPIQVWLNEHHQLMKYEAWELAAMLKFLNGLISEGSQCPGTADMKDSIHDSKILCNGEEIYLQVASAIKKMGEEIYKQSLELYYKACQNLVPSEGSGACRNGFQAGFRPSTSRTSLFSLSATDLDVSSTKVVGGDAGMIEVTQKLDPASREYNIPSSQLYGSNLLLRTGNLVVQIRNYTYPLFFATFGRCEGRIVLAQQIDDAREHSLRQSPDTYTQIVNLAARGLGRIRTIVSHVATTLSSGPAVNDPIFALLGVLWPVLEKPFRPKLRNTTAQSIRLPLREFSAIPMSRSVAIQEMPEVPTMVPLRKEEEEKLECWTFLICSDLFSFFWLEPKNPNCFKRMTKKLDLICRAKRKLDLVQSAPTKAKANALLGLCIVPCESTGSHDLRAHQSQSSSTSSEEFN